MNEGTVKFFSPKRGFGFITPASGGKDAFVHISVVEKAGLTGLTEGQNVTYDVEEDRGGKPSAVNLQVVK
ncbi:cold-shock protein [Devosia geojensis]|uniref:Cold-shock protein n=1 Tax=Devosia geojensis TaxID=443610 RepID=A0A0F5FNM0_9HYPH|nr:cold-shock protein [Devosia geojensis]KKB10441.1 cold-shock protein [Devosia geojensis]